MSKVEKLQAALRWALQEGAGGGLHNGKLNLHDGGCGCCSGSIEPPEELRAVIVEAISAQGKTAQSICCGDATHGCQVSPS